MTALQPEANVKAQRRSCSGAVSSEKETTFDTQSTSFRQTLRLSLDFGGSPFPRFYVEPGARGVVLETLELQAQRPHVGMC